LQSESFQGTRVKVLKRQRLKMKIKERGKERKGKKKNETNDVIGRKKRRKSANQERK